MAGRPPPPPPRPPNAQLNALTTYANQIRTAAVTKNRNIAAFNNSLKDRIRILDNLSEEILRKLRAMGGRGADFQRVIDEQGRQIADLNRRMREAADAQAAATAQVADLTRQLNEARARGGDVDALTRQLADLQTQYQNNLDELDALNQGITAANNIIADALAQLNAPDDNAELQALLAQLERHINEINGEIDRINVPAQGGPGGAGGPVRGPGGGPQPPPPPPRGRGMPGGSKAKKTRRKKTFSKKATRSKY